MHASERQHHVRAVRNSPSTGVILAKAAFFKIDEEDSDTDSRNIDTRFFRAPASALRKRARLPL
jgi:hypothetical protein